MPRNLKKSQRLELIRIVEYMVSGGAYFWSGYLVFAACDKGLHLSLWWAKLAANITGVTINFLLTRFWVFSGRNLKKDLPQVTSRYIVITLINFVIDYFIIRGLKSIGITPYIGQFVSAGFFTVWNYLWYKLWVFATPKRKLMKKSTKSKRRVNKPRRAIA